jgi:tetratricopeptide (TPR) repeat protein
MSPSFFLLLLGFVYIVLFGALALLRREGLSLRFALESLVITLSLSAVPAFTGIELHPVLFLIILYLITMRSRLLVDLGNLFARRGQYSQATSIYNLALNLWPDASTRLIVQVNQGAALIQQNNLDEAIVLLSQVLQSVDQGRLGIKHEAACHYNLGVAYRAKKMTPQAMKEFRAVLDVWPVSEYGRRAQLALEREHQETK